MIESLLINGAIILAAVLGYCAGRSTACRLERLEGIQLEQERADQTERARQMFLAGREFWPYPTIGRPPMTQEMIDDIVLTPDVFEDIDGT